jgi:hypothetical protein
MAPVTSLFNAVALAFGPTPPGFSAVEERGETRSSLSKAWTLTAESQRDRC